MKFKGYILLLIINVKTDEMGNKKLLNGFFLSRVGFISVVSPRWLCRGVLPHRFFATSRTWTTRSKITLLSARTMTGLNLLKAMRVWISVLESLRVFGFSFRKISFWLVILITIGSVTASNSSRFTVRFRIPNLNTSAIGCLTLSHRSRAF